MRLAVNIIAPHFSENGCSEHERAVPGTVRTETSPYHRRKERVPLRRRKRSQTEGITRAGHKLGILGLVNDAHTAAAELFDDAVARNGLTDHVVYALTAAIPSGAAGLRSAGRNASRPRMGLP